MSELTTLARPYAVAAYNRAKETGTTQQWADALAFLSVVMGNEQVVQAATNPKAKRADFTTAFLDLCQGHLDAEAENFVRLLIQNHRLDLVKQIAELFEAYKAEAEGYVDADVTTAYALDDNEWKTLESVIGRYLNKQARLRVFVDNSLIGGVYIRAGDRVIDASVRGQIERLAKRLWN
ncbi:F0F1 ATP synthase subunit delta [Methylomagnum sp.]